MRDASPYTFWSQYMGDPTAVGTGLIQEEWLQYYDELPVKDIIKTYMTADTASTSKDYSDYSVICLWHETRDKHLYLGDVTLGKWETPELRSEIIRFWNEKNVLDIRYPCLIPTAMYMENKASGQYLNQQFARDGNIRLLPIPRDKSSGDKVARFLNTVTHFAQGKIHFPKEHEHLHHVVREVISMTGEGSGTGHDDVCDNVSDACVITYGTQSANYLAWVD